MAPILKKGAARTSVGQCLQIVDPVGTEARKRRQGVGAGQHVDRIDLHDTQALEETPQGTLVVDLHQAWLAETLGRKGDAPGLGERKAVAPASH